MHYAVIAVAQQALRLYPDLDTYRRHLERFFRLAEAKRARLLIFPEQSALMVVPPLVEGFRTNLLKKAESGRGRYTSWWERTRGELLRSTAKLLGADMGQTVRQALAEIPEFIWQKYVDVFSSLAYDYKMTVIAGSGYFRDVNDRTMRHITTVFGPDGDILGQHAKVLLSKEEQEIASPGRGWQVVETPIGRLGILMGEEVMYPEVGRLLAYQGAEALVVLAATTNDETALLLREGLRARVTDNQVFGALAFCVGENPLAPEGTPPFRGRSVVMAPHGLTPRQNGIIVEAGSASAEVIVTARWDFEALRSYWQSVSVPVRRRVPVDRVGAVLAALYKSGLSLEDAEQRPLPEAQALPQAELLVEEEAPQEASPPAPVTETAPPAEPPPEEDAPEPEVASSTPEDTPPTPAPEGLPTVEEGGLEGKVMAPTMDPEETPRLDEASQPAAEVPLDEGGDLPEALWKSVKTELERAAHVLRSLTDPLFEEKPSEESSAPASPPAETTTATPPTSGREATGQGWFHRLLERRKQGKGTWEEW